MRKLATALGLTFTVALAAEKADAFCGFYIAGADTQMFNEATQVVLMRDGTRTVLSMQNDYKGPPSDFALVIPVPVVLQKENVKTLPREVFANVDALGSPRLVEYWEQDPCSPDVDFDGAAGGLGGIGIGLGRGAGAGSGQGMGTVKIEAQFEVGEYEIVILSAKDSTGLDTWLRENNYKIPAGAEAALRPYVANGSKFFVAKVNAAKLPMENGRAALSPLRFHYDSEKFELPVKLGMLNSTGTQDLVVHILAPHQRYVVANYPNVTIPTNLDVAPTVRTSFGAYYKDLFDKTIAATPNAVVTEYSWAAGNCDPCPGKVQGLAAEELATLGADVLPSAQAALMGSPLLRDSGATISGPGKMPPEVIRRIVRQNFGRFRLCYEKELRSDPKLGGKVEIDFTVDDKGAVSSSKARPGAPNAALATCSADIIKKLSFPTPEGGSTMGATYTMMFSPSGGPTASSRNFAADMVLTRLHARYKKGALAADLVFKTAGPIAGGRETRGKDGQLEKGATPVANPGTSGLGAFGGGPLNNFQARYAIRNQWKGPIACKKPKRGVWGDPWPGVETQETVALTNPLFQVKALAAAPAVVPSASAAPEPPPPVDAGAPAVQAAPKPAPVPPPTKTGCGCDTTSRSETGALAAALAFVAFSIRRRRRR